MKRIVAIAAFACLAVTLSCNQHITAGQDIEELLFTKNQARLWVGDTVTVVAGVTDASGASVSDVSVAYSSSNPTVVSITPKGNNVLVTAVALGTATITGTATKDGITASAEIAVTVAEPGLKSLAVSQTHLSLTAGDTTTVSATVTDSAGNPVSTPSITYSSTDAAIVSVSPQGSAVLVTAVKVGTASVLATATKNGTSASATIPVIVKAPVDTTTIPTPVAPWYEQNWDYTSTATMKAAAWSVTELSGASVALQETGVEGGQSSVNKALRAIYSTTGESTAKTGIRPPNWNVTKPREVWVEIWIRFNAAWVTNSDDKTFFYLEDHSLAGGPLETNRWETHLVAPTLWYGGPSGGVVGLTIPDYFKNNTLNVNPWDGAWHRFRQHLKMSSTPSALDGAYKVWWDDIVILDKANFGSGSPAQAFFHSIYLGANADPKGSGIRDWGRVRVYITNPGW
jgi:hypothetical protein